LCPPVGGQSLAQHPFRSGHLREILNQFGQA
jgi:hypothetical protein